MKFNKKITFSLFVLFFILATLYFIYYFLVIPKDIITLPKIDSKLQESPIIDEKTVDFGKINPEFLFYAHLPNEFNLEYAPSLKAINIYDPNISGKSNLEKSQIYITLFKADSFLTLNTVKITRQDKVFINGKEAILYEITKKETAPNFAGQPVWRNFKHRAIDIRHLQDGPSYFYSFAKNPNLPQKIFDDFINSLIFTDK